MTEKIPPWLEQTTFTLESTPRFPVTLEHLEVERITFASIFERIIEGLEQGKTLTAVLDNDPRTIDRNRLLRWIRKDKERLARFEEAKEHGTLFMEDELLEIADGADSTEDVQRSRLRSDNRKYIMERWNPKRYGARQQIDHTIVNIDIVAAMDRGKRLALERRGILIEGESEVVDG